MMTPHAADRSASVRHRLPMQPQPGTIDETVTVDAVVAADKEARLLERIATLGRVLVAFSGGVDSAYVAWAAFRALGATGGAVAVTGVSDSLAAEQLEDARALAAEIGIAHELVATQELSDPRYLANQGDRCYWCKSELYDRLTELARERGCAVVIDGSNQDDLGDLRPGRRAAGERAVASPLIDVGLGKSEIRWLSRRAGLPTWHQPASPCLSSRVPHGVAIEPGFLARIELAERAVRDLGFREFRVRHLGDRARIEISAAELERARQLSDALVRAVEGAGFASAFVDSSPFRSGRLNEPGERPPLQPR